MLSANNGSRNVYYGTPECDKDELATKIEDLASSADSKEETMKGKATELSIRESLVKAQKSTIAGFEGVLSENQKTLQERTTEETSWQKTIGDVTANLTSYQEQRIVKDKELDAAKDALQAARSEEQSVRVAYGSSLVDYRMKGKASAEQRILVAESQKTVKDAKEALAVEKQAAEEVCAEAADLRAKATKASEAHAAAVQELKKATDIHTNAEQTLNTRKSELSGAQQILEAATASRADAAKKRADECRQSNTAELQAGSAETLYRHKQKECVVLEAEEQRLIQLQAAAQAAYDAASRESNAAAKALGEAENALAAAKAVDEDASSDLEDAEEVHTAASKKESTLCDKAKQAEDKLAATVSLLREAEDVESKAQFDDFTASNALTTAISVETQSCDAAGKAKCAMNRAKGALDAAKLRYDSAVEARKAQEVVVKTKSSTLETAKKSMEEGKSTVETADKQHDEAGKAKAWAFAKQAKQFLVMKAAKWKLNIAVISQGRAKATYDTAIEQVTCVTARHEKAVGNFEKAAATLSEKEKTKNICEEDVQAAKEPEKADELLKKLQVAYDGVEIHVGVWTKAKAVMEQLKHELDTKTQYLLSKEAYYNEKVKYSQKLTAERKEAQTAYDAATAEFDAACKAKSSAYDHLVSWQKTLEVRVEQYNIAVDEYNSAQQYLNDLIAAENSAKMAYEAAQKFWNAKVKDHGVKEGKCSDAEAGRKTAEENKDKTATTLAEATAQVEGLVKRRDCDTTSRDTAKSHCKDAQAELTDSNADLAQSREAKSKAADALKKAEKAKSNAEAVNKAADDKQAAAKAALEKATQDAAAQTTASIKCDKEEEVLRLAWVQADAKAEQEQKQCATACAGLTAANNALEAAQSAYNTAFANHEAAEKVEASTAATKQSANCAATTAGSLASGAESRAVKKEASCAKLNAEVEVLKNELVTAQTTLKTEVDSLAQMGAAATAAKTVLTQLQDQMKQARAAIGAAHAAVLLAQDALDEVLNCIDTNQKNLLDLQDELSKAQDAIAETKDLIGKEQSKIDRAKSVLLSYEADVNRLKLEVEAAQSALVATKKALSDAEITLDTCVSSRCDPPSMAISNYDLNQNVPNLVHGATWSPRCERGFKVDFCDSESACGVDAAVMTCSEGKLSPPTFRCAPILSGTLVVKVNEGRKLSFGEEKFSYSNFEFHPIPSDPYVRVEACPGMANADRQETSIKHNAYDAVWSDEAPMSFRISGEDGCNTFQIAVRDDREDDDSRCEWSAMDYVGAVDELSIVEGRPLEKFMIEANVEHSRRIISKSGGVLDFFFTWKADDDGPIKSM